MSGGVSEVHDDSGEVVGHAIFEERDRKKVATIVWRSPQNDETAPSHEG